MYNVQCTNCTSFWPKYGKLHITFQNDMEKIINRQMPKSSQTLHFLHIIFFKLIQTLKVTLHLHTANACSPLSLLKSIAFFLSVTISFNFTMFLWDNCLKIFISLTAVIGKPSFSLSKRTFFKATISPKQHEKSSLELRTGQAWSRIRLRNIAPTLY